MWYVILILMFLDAITVMKIVEEYGNISSTAAIVEEIPVMVCDGSRGIKITE